MLKSARMKKLLLFLIVLMPVHQHLLAQIDPHYTMFMFDKLIYNPGYAGASEVTSANATYRDQWVGINGAPKTLNVSVDGLIGNYTNEFRRVALGVDINNETEGITTNTNLMAYYAYRIKINRSILSMGLEGGGAFYSADVSQLNLSQQNDPLFNQNVKNAFLPNFGAGLFLYNEKYYLGLSVPNLIQNYYDPNGTKIDNENSRQIRSYYASGGYVFTINDNICFEPQFIARYAGNSMYSLPFSADLNASLIFHKMFMVGVTYRTDNSIDLILHVQATKEINIGYAYDYSTQLINAFSYGTHEITVGFNFVRDRNAYTNPRFVKMF